MREGDVVENKVSRSPTFRRAKPLTRNLKHLQTKKIEETGARRKATGRRQQMEEEAKAFGTVSPGTPEQFRKLALANLSFLDRVSVSHEAKHTHPLQQFLSFANEEKLVLVADDEVDEAIV